VEKLFKWVISKEESLLKSVVTREYIEVNPSDIEFKWEERDCNWDNYTHRYYGFVPYIDGEETHLYHIKTNSSGEEYMSMITSAEDGSYRVYPEHFKLFGLVRPEPINV